MSFQSYIVSQFRQPRGSAGRLAGYIMDKRPSNRLRNSWTVDLLELEIDSRVLEIGCGPGLALEACLGKVKTGRVAGLDHSALMVNSASARLRKEVDDGLCTILHGDLSLLTHESTQYDRIYSVNVVQFLGDLEEAYKAIFSRMRPNGIAATTYMPRMKGAAKRHAQQKAIEIGRVMQSVGFVGIKTDTLDIEPAPAICVRGQKV